MHRLSYLKGSFVAHLDNLIVVYGNTSQILGPSPKEEHIEQEV